MDFTPIIQAAVKQILWVLPFIIFIGFLRTPKVKGIIGEALVKFLAKIKLPKDVYHPIHNVTLPTDDGTTQIDHIFVSQFGVFVVETKNMKGWIFGGESQAQWTQQIFKEKNKFQNPLRQNFKHVKTLESALGISPEAIISVIAFTGECTLKTEMPPNVTRGIGFVDYIKSYSLPILSKSQVQSIAAQIEAGRLEPSRKTDKEHVQNLKTRHESVPEKNCSNYGKAMVLRRAKKGANKGSEFWGCSGFPSCRAIQKIT
ncbi:nuclease [Chromatiales bacterium (ex Bugula neritina AB1)]|nr:nuclease [Chromatiales bacterium (ex Bugula neritina AB1)]